MKKTNQHRRKNRAHSKSNANKYSANYHKLYMIPLIIIAGIIPLIIRYHEYETGLSVFSWFSTEDTNIDFFLYFKQLYFILTCSIMLIIIGFKIYMNKKVKIGPIFIPLGIYGLLALLSTVFSKYSSFGYSGIYEQFESVFVLLGYCLIVLYAYLFINKEEDVLFVFRYFTYGVIILGVIGTLQAFGHDFFASAIGLKTILPRVQWSNISDFKFSFGENCSYLTLYNPNYVGVYVALVAPILFCLMLTSKVKKTIVLYLIALIGLGISLYSSQSASGLISIIASTVIILLFMRRYIFRKSRFTVPIIFIGIGVFFIIGVLKFDALTSGIISLIPSENATNPLTDIKTEEDIVLTYYGSDLRINYTLSEKSELNFSFKDSTNQEVEMIANAETNAYDIIDERFTGISVSPVTYSDIFCIKVQVNGYDWLFSNQLGDGTYYYINRLNRADKIVTADSAVFTGYESFASTRGYLWSRTIPLFKDYIVLGSGADTFAIAFPQQDYVNLHNYGFTNSIVTKPHNIYMQMGVQTGVLSLIAFLVFYLMYFCSSVLLYIKGQFEDTYAQFGVAVFIGTIGFMITGISNDSSITVSPVFWTMIGIGVAVNMKVKEKNKK